MRLNWGRGSALAAPCRRTIAAAVALWLALPMGAAYAQADQDKAAARSLATQGAEAFAAGRFDETIDLVSRAEALVHAPTHLLLIARAEARLGRLVGAKETYLKIVREELPPTAPAAFKKAQQDARDELAAVDPRIASLRIALDGAAGRKIAVKIDDQPVADALLGVHRPIDPGKHVIVALPPGLGPIEQSISLGDGEKKDVTIPIPPAPAGAPGPVAGAPGAATPPANQPPEPPPPAGGARANMLLVGSGIGAGVLGLGGVVVGALFAKKGASTQHDADDLFNLCKGHCRPVDKAKIESLDSRAASQKTTGAVGLIAGGVFVAGGATLVVLGLSSKSEPQTTGWVAPYLTPTGFGVQGAF